ncbi:MAG: ankyrin repeat domain-containing protein [Acidimicrobiales bacterium]|nr:ankyrin repeat domain-containing protein [Acidimicrobiales bacterium]
MLVAAIDADDEDAARALVDRDPSVLRAVCDGGSIVRRAARAGFVSLLAHIVDLEVGLDLGDAAAAGDVVRVQALIDADPDAVDAVGGDGYRALHVAAYYGQVKVAELLLNRGASVDAVSDNAYAMQPLHAAASRAHAVVVHLLLDHGADVDAPMTGGYRPLHAAADGGHAAMVQLLLERGADPNGRTDAGLLAVDIVEDPDTQAVLRAV